MTESVPTQPTAVLCGSLARHARLFPAAAASLWARGFAVYAPALDPQVSEQEHATRHRALIDTAALVVVVTDPSGYVGEATASEREYAGTRGVPVEVWTGTTSAPDFKARLVEAFNSCHDPLTPEREALRETRRHDGHQYHHACAVCRGDLEELADRALSEVVEPELSRLRLDVWELRGQRDVANKYALEQQARADGMWPAVVAARDEARAERASMVRDLHAAIFDGSTSLPDRPLDTVHEWLLGLVRADRARIDAASRSGWGAGNTTPTDDQVDRVALFLLRTKVYGTNADAHYDTSAATQWQRVLTDAEREHWRDWARKLITESGAVTNPTDGAAEKALRADLRLEEDNVEFIEKTLHLVLGCCDGEQDECRGVEPVYASVRAGERPPILPAEERSVRLFGLVTDFFGDVRDAMKRYSALVDELPAGPVVPAPTDPDPLRHASSDGVDPGDPWEITGHSYVPTEVCHTCGRDRTAHRSARLTVTWHEDAIRAAVDHALAIVQADQTDPDDVYRVNGKPIRWMDLACLVDSGRAVLADHPAPPAVSEEERELREDEQHHATWDGKTDPNHGSSA